MNGALSWLPGAGLLRQAWDATKLAGAILDRRQEKALVVAKERQQRLAPYRGRKATTKMKEVFESEDPAEIARLFVPDKVVDVAKDAGEVYWKIWDLYWILVIVR